MKRCLTPLFFLALTCLALLSAAWSILVLLAFIGGLFTLVMITLNIWQGTCGWMEGIWRMLVASVVLACFWAVLCDRWRRYVSQRLRGSDLKEPARQALNLPYSTLLERWPGMVAVDADCVAIHEDKHCLSWDDTTWRSVIVQGVGNENWVAFLSHDAVSGLSCFRTAKICRQEGVQLPAHCRWLRADGIAIYRSGQLSVYPASRLEVLKRSFPMLVEDEAFSPWLDASAKVGEFDS